MALIGMLLAHGYGRRVRELLPDEGGPWAGWLEDPQILVDQDLIADFSAAAQAAGQDAAALLRIARDGLIDALHAGHWLIVLVVGLAFMLARRLPAMSLQPAAETDAGVRKTTARAEPAGSVQWPVLRRRAPMATGTIQ